MTLGFELRTIRDEAKVKVFDKIKNWFEESKEMLYGAAESGADCIEFNNPEDLNFWGKMFDENEILIGDYCEEQEIEIETVYGSDNKLNKVVISWNELFVQGDDYGTVKN